jgi:hypothetical protein
MAIFAPKEMAATTAIADIYLKFGVKTLESSNFVLK